jgi:uncharacterized protein
MSDSIEFSEKDRLFLINQYKILARLSDDDDDVAYFEHCVTILENGYESHYDELGVIESPMSAEESDEVRNILAMFEVLHDSYEKLDDKSGIEEWTVRFGGFDGNNEGRQLGYVRFLANQGDNYFPDVLTLKDYNSHCPSIDRYRKMLEHLRRDYPNRRLLNKEQLLEVVRAGLNRQHA